MDPNKIARGGCVDIRHRRQLQTHHTHWFRVYGHQPPPSLRQLQQWATPDLDQQQPAQAASAARAR